ncbi:MAG: phosphatidylinositol kinase [Bacteroidaceae bacterium]|nr:phosphatidylinositol kinase [Bacteroidaceae bacterium]
MLFFLRGTKAGILTEDENDYTFEYDADYLTSACCKDCIGAVGLTKKGS